VKPIHELSWIQPKSHDVMLNLKSIPNGIGINTVTFFVRTIICGNER
jgi:hypothetical protein